jgi:hypothetical protein
LPRGAVRPPRWFEPVLIALVLVVAYNANGREIGSWDSQPTRSTIEAILLHGTLRLDEVTAHVRAAVMERPGYVVDRRHHLRSAYPVAPAILAAGLAWPWERLGLIDITAPMGASLVAKAAASLIVAAAMALAFVVARRRVSSMSAAVIALGLGLGTNFWALASQTLWQHETVALGMLGALALVVVPTEQLTVARLLGASALLGLAGAARPQVAIALAIIAIWMVTRRGRWQDILTLAPLAIIGGVVMSSNVAWFGHPLGATPRLEALHETLHGVGGSLGAEPWMAAAGLLVSPSRGLLVFSPVVLVAAVGLIAASREGWRSELRWCALAVAAQFAVYASYSVWWAGHTYGPRYCLDLLPPMVPLAAAGLPILASGRWLRVAATLALAWSVALAATGAFVYPADAWNLDPANVDQNHARLWMWSDPQFVRCWTTATDPRNFRLFTLDAVRRPPPSFPR